MFGPQIGNPTDPHTPLLRPAPHAQIRSGQDGLEFFSGYTPLGDICKIWTSEPDRFIIDLVLPMPEPTTRRQPASGKPGAIQTA